MPRKRSVRYKRLHARFIRAWVIGKLRGEELQINYPKDPELERVLRRRIKEIEKANSLTSSHS